MQNLVSIVTFLPTQIKMQLLFVSSFNPAILKPLELLKLGSCDLVHYSMPQTNSYHPSKQHSCCSPLHIQLSTAQGNPDKQCKGQQRKMLLWLSGGWDGQDSSHERFVTDMQSRNNLFHQVVCYIYPEMKKAACLRRKGRSEYVHISWIDLKEGGLLFSKKKNRWGRRNWGVTSANACLGLDHFLTLFLSSVVDMWATSLT